MFNEIGSYFALDQKLTDPGGNIVQWFKGLDKIGVHDYTWSSSGRGALTLLLKHYKSSNRRAMLPAYICESVITSFLFNHFEVNFYDINIDLSLNEDSLFESVSRNKPGIVFVISYFGFDTLAGFRPKYDMLRKSGIIVIEDISHSLLSHYETTGADYYLASIRKWLGIPDGGIAISKKGDLIPGTQEIHSTFVDMSQRAMLFKQDYIKSLNPELKKQYRDLFRDSEALLDSDCNYYMISNISSDILAGTDFNELGLTRYTNYKHLLASLDCRKLIRPVFGSIQAGVVPLHFPVYIERNRDKIQKHLAGKGIYAPVHWPIPGKCRDHISDSTSYVYQNILSLPCDQRYNKKDMDRIAEVLNTCDQQD